MKWKSGVLHRCQVSLLCMKLETNEIGCSLYSYNKTTYWKCPDKSINSVDVVGYKGYTKQEPVVK